MENQEIRQRLVALLEQADGPQTLGTLSEQLGMADGASYTRLARLVAAMDNDREIVITEDGQLRLPLAGKTLEGSFRQNKKGFGFVRVEESEEDIFVQRTATDGAMNDDTVQVLVESDGDDYKRAKPSGVIQKIVERNTPRLTGTFTPYTDQLRQQTGHLGTIKPLNKGCENLNCAVAAEGLHPTEGEIVVYEITEFPTADAPFDVVGLAKQSLGYKDAPGSDIRAILSMFEIPSEFPDEVMAEAEALPETISAADRDGRSDYREAMTITIDSAESKDLDDAISLRVLDNGNYELGVHIADVSHYVQSGTALDAEALKRGTSVYLTDRVVPMLPQRLSNGICSLNEGQERLTMSCVMEIDHNGHILHQKIGPSVIRSNHRMTYDAVNRMIAGDSAVRDEYADLTPTLDQMVDLHEILAAMRHRRGAIDFDTPEAEIIVDENGHPTDIRLRERGTAERLIESFMLAANETVARVYKEKELPIMYRVHEAPEADRIQDFIVFAKALGVNVTKTDGQVTPKDLQQTLTRIEGQPYKPVIQMMMLRSMQQAKYANTPLGHYGLAATDYTHFTSPIRRYPDLLVHRLIHQYLEKVPSEAERTQIYEGIEPTAEHASAMERRSVDAEREVDSLKKAEYMVDKVGEEFDAIISSITGFGMFVELPNTVEGLVHISTLKEDYFSFDQEHLLLIGEHTGKIYRIGQPVKVRLVSANPEARQIDFELLTDTPKKHHKKNGKPSNKKGKKGGRGHHKNGKANNKQKHHN